MNDCLQLTSTVFCLLLFLIVILLSCFIAVLIERDRLKRKYQEVQSAILAKNDFVADMSHEIRTPLNAIIGFSEMLSSTPLSQQQQAYLKTIKNSGQLLLSFANDFLDFSKLEVGAVKADSIDFDLEQLVHDVFKIAQVRFIEKQIYAYVDIDSQVPRWVKGDPTRLRQAILNILNNATKSTQRKEVGFIVSLVRKESDQVFNIRFAVKGTEFYFVVSLKEGVATVEENIMPISNETLKIKTVIIVDDHLPSLEITVRYCKEMGLNVLKSVSSGQAALDAINDLFQTGILPDLILSDVIMPHMDGYELVKKIRQVKAFKAIHAIALTSDVRIGSARISHDSGFDGFLPKPFSRLELKNMVLTVLGDKRADSAPIVTRHVAQEVILKGIKVLVVDDSLANLDLMKSYLNKFGCICDVAYNGQEAVEKILNGRYDLCLMDLQMPGLSGDEATRVIRQQGIMHLPIIGLTAAVTAEDQQRCLSAGMNDFIVKPVEVNVLREKINQWGRI